ncbi:MAG: hypothetical protein L0Z50_03410 [Verrucomicrobiales bacterium]|nr:hypothetical protein [Verrucomicrobiales bacterium]
MTHQEIKKAAGRRPFRPFAIRLSDGEVVAVQREQEIAINPHNRKTVVVFDTDGTVRVLDVAQVTELALS